MNGSEPNDWLTAGLRHPPTPDEERRWKAYLDEHPGERPAREEDMFLNQLLRQLPDAPVATNFTARVLQAVDREPTGRPRAIVPAAVARWFSHLNWATTAALLALAIVVGVLGYQRHRRQVRSELARSVVAVTPVATLPTVEALEHFEAIRKLSLAQPVQDRDLLTTSQ